MSNHGCFSGELSLLFALFTATSLAQPDPNQRFVLAGRVVNAVTGEPIGRALVSWHPPRHPVPNSPIMTPSTGRTFTDTAGAFRFTGMAPTHYRLEVTKPHFTTDGTTFLHLTGAKDDLEIRMTPLSSIEGIFTDDTGTALAMAVIETYQFQVNDGFAGFQRVRIVNTDDRGRFRMWDLSAGKYLIRAAGRMGGTVAVSSSQMPRVEWNRIFAPTFHDGSKQRKSISPIELHAGENRRIDFSAPVQPSYKVRGAIQNVAPSGEPKITIHDSFGEQTTCRISYDPGSGSFQVNDLVAGTYKIRVTQGQKEHERRGETEVKLAGTDATDVSVTLSPGATISGITHCAEPALETTNGQNRFRVCYASLRLVNTETGEGLSRDYGRNDSSWKIGPVFPGEYRIEVSAGGSYVSSVLAGGVPLTPGATLALGPGAAPPDLEVMTKSSAARINVALAPAVNLLLAQVLLVSDTPQFQRARLTYCQDGCTFLDLAPGDYRLFLFPRNFQIAYNDPQTTANLQGGVRVHLTENSQQTVTLTRFAE